MADLPRCFRIDPADNVATLLDDAGAGPVRLLGGERSDRVEAAQPIEAGHKIALRDLEPDEPVVKFGVAIGAASEPIAAGGWVHLHNCRSHYDQRSQSLDVHTGAATDTRYD